MIVALLVVAALLPRVSATPASRPAEGPGAAPFERVGTLAGTQINEAEDHDGVVFTPDGRLFLVADSDATFVRLWDLRTLKPVTAPLKHRHVVAFSVTADGKTVFTNAGGEVRLWDVATSKLRGSVKADMEDLSFFHAAPDGRRFLTIPGDGRILTVWDATGGHPTKAYDVSSFDILNSAYFDPTGRYIVVKEFIGAFGLLQADTGRPVCPPFDAMGTKSKANYLAPFDPSGRRLAVPTEGGFRLMDCASGKTLVAAHLHGGMQADKLSFSPDGSLVATAPWDTGPILVFDAATARLVRQINFVDVIRYQLSPGGRFLLCNHGEHAEPDLVDLHTGATVQTFPSTRGINGLAVMSPDGRTILVGIRPDAIAVWRLRHAGPTTRP